MGGGGTDTCPWASPDDAAEEFGDEAPGYFMGERLESGLSGSKTGTSMLELFGMLNRATQEGPYRLHARGCDPAAVEREFSELLWSVVN